MNDFLLLPFFPEQAQEISDLIGRVLLEVNIKNYPREALERFAEYYSAETVLELALRGQMFVALDGERAIGCGAVVALEDRPGVSEIRALFVLPEYEGQGVGSTLMAVLESDPIFTRADRVVVSASLTAHSFYEKLGYRYVGGVPVCEDNDHYWMEKVNT